MPEVPLPPLGEAWIWPWAEPSLMFALPEATLRRTITEGRSVDLSLR